jgi:hypothetical protein
VILDGGPTRVFSPSDATLLEEDLEILKVYHYLKYNLAVFCVIRNIVLPGCWLFCAYYASGTFNVVFSLLAKQKTVSLDVNFHFA